MDSSIALQWVLPEAGNEAALSLLGRPDLMAPDILLIESANVLAKKVRAGDTTLEKARNGLGIITQAVSVMVHSAALADKALGIAVDFGHPAYDCCFFACALSNNAKLATRDLPFIKRLVEHGQLDHLHFPVGAS